VAQQLRRLGQGALPQERAVVPGVLGGDRCRRGLLAALRERVLLGGRADGEGGVADRAVAGAAAQVPAQRVQVEAVRAVLGVAAGRVRVRAAVRPVVLGGHAADEPRRAVAALGAAADRHLLLHRVQGGRRARFAGGGEALGGDDLLAVERRGRDQAGV